MGLNRFGRLDREITFERRVPRSGRGQAGQEVWEPVVTLWAEVQDVLPSRGERLSDGMVMANRPARIRTHFIDGITADMRIVYGDRIMQIVAGPAEIGRQEGLELMAQSYSSGEAP